MKKDNQNLDQLKKEIKLNKNLKVDQIKTTNINILLNRVKLDQKKTFKKKFIFTVILISIVISLAAYFIV